MEAPPQAHVEIPVEIESQKRFEIKEDSSKIDINNKVQNINCIQNQPNNEIENNSLSFQKKDEKDSQSISISSKSEQKNVSIVESEININIDLDIRSKFLLKVFGILLTQFIFTFATILICQIETIKKFLFSHTLLYIILLSFSGFIFITAFIIFICNPNLVRKVPHNYIILFSITICETILLTYISILYQFEYILGAISFIIAICLALFSIALFNKIHFKFLTMSLIILLYVAIAYGIIAIIVRNYYIRFLYCLIGAVIFSLFIVYDTQLIRDEYSTDDYIFAALTLYFDVIRLFIQILRILGNSGRSRN